MTRERIAALKASRETDAIISRLVMGVVWDESRCRVCGWPLAETTAAGCVADNCSMRPLPKRRADEPAPYSTDIEAAFRIVARMRAHGQPRFSNLSLTVYCYSRTYASFDGAAFGDWSVETHAEANGEHATPLAICMAALMAVEAMDAETRKASRVVRA